VAITDCEALVLAAADFAEADRIVTLFTREQGKVRAVARHAKRSVRRFGGALETFARLRVQLVLKEGLCSLRLADIISVFPAIRGELAKIGHAGYACEVVDRLLPEALSNPRLYRLLVSYLEHLEAFPPTQDGRRFFEVNLLNILGYRLPLENCVRCGAGLAAGPGPALFTAAGELLCGRCGGGGRPVGAETLLLLRRSMETGRFGAVRFPPEALSEAGAVLDAAIGSHLVRPLNSLLFLREVPGADPG
jgi:DNA repair protein RecO (recombination protein O)